MKLIKSVTIGPAHNADEDVVIRLANGKVVQVSPEFDAINVFDSPEAFENFNMHHCKTFTVAMGAGYVKEGA